MESEKAPVDLGPWRVSQTLFLIVSLRSLSVSQKRVRLIF